MSKVQQIEIDDGNVGQRVDNFLRTCLKGVPKSRIYRLIRKGEVRVNKGRIKPEYKLCLGDVVRVPPVRQSETEHPVAGTQNVQRILDAIIYEDERLLVVNKPSGLAVHGGSGIKLGLIEILRQAKPLERSLELVHRLDRDTSGCIMVAKKRALLTHLHEQLRSKTMDKTYLALVVGRWPKAKRLVNAPLRKNTLQSGERMVVVAPDGKPAETRFEVLKRFDKYTLVRAMPITGRTHQIRVHCQYIGHPIAGDAKYTKDEDNAILKKLGLRRLFLHAAALDVAMPDRKDRLKLEAPLDPHLAELLERL